MPKILVYKGVTRESFICFNSLGKSKLFKLPEKNTQIFSSKIRIHFWKSHLATYGKPLNSNGLQILKEHNSNHI